LVFVFESLLFESSLFEVSEPFPVLPVLGGFTTGGGVGVTIGVVTTGGGVTTGGAIGVPMTVITCAKVFAGCA
jgi:hypothetical protein